MKAESDSASGANHCLLLTMLNYFSLCISFRNQVLDKFLCCQSLQILSIGCPGYKALLVTPGQSQRRLRGTGTRRDLPLGSSRMSHPAPSLTGPLLAKAVGEGREEKHIRPQSSEIPLLKCSRVTDNWKRDCTTEIPAARSFHSSLGICCCAPQAIGCGLAGPLSDPGQMFCSSVKPQKQLQKQHGTNSTGNTYDTKMVWLSAPRSHRQPPRHRQGTRTCHSQTLGFGLPGGGRCAAYHPPLHTEVISTLLPLLAESLS